LHPQQNYGTIRPIMEIASLLERTSLAKTPEWRNVDLKTFRDEIIPRDRPAVMKGLVEHWPIARASTQSTQALFDYIRARDLSRPIRVMVGQPDIKGVYFYRDDMTGLNFEYAYQPLHTTLATILACMKQSNPSAIYTGATSTAENFPQIGRENSLAILDESATSWLWLGNAVTAATGCHLYPGPLVAQRGVARAAESLIELLVVRGASRRGGAFWSACAWIAGDNRATRQRPRILAEDVRPLRVPNQR
jgi:Cupin-like domain